MERHILIVDDEVNILNALERLLDEQEDFVVYRATSGLEGLTLLEQNPQIGVVVSDQRMPNMTGIEFLKQVKSRHSNIVRMILSGYAEMGSITQAINEGAVFKFHSKPWEEERLLDSIRESFEYYQLTEENRNLTLQLQESHAQLKKFNASLKQRVEEKTRSLQLHIASLHLYQEAIEQLPFAVIGLDYDFNVALDNRAARKTLSDLGTSLLGLPVTEVFTGAWHQISQEVTEFNDQKLSSRVTLTEHNSTVTLVKLGTGKGTLGLLLFIVPLGA